jgi:hypothetical protein
MARFRSGQAAAPARRKRLSRLAPDRRAHAIVTTGPTIVIRVARRSGDAEASRAEMKLKT